LDSLNVKVDGVIVALGHDEFKRKTLDEIKKFMNNKPIIVDVGGIFNGEEAKRKGFYYKRL
jgi:UDP-N-acetyl-D-mannosaminuronate dehydrogenase